MITLYLTAEDITCLAPKVLPYNVGFVNSTHDSLTLSMPVPRRPQECNELTMPTPRYHIYYGPVVSNETEGCLNNVAFCLNKVCIHYRLILIEQNWTTTSDVIHPIRFFAIIDVFRQHCGLTKIATLHSVRHLRQYHQPLLAGRELVADGKRHAPLNPGWRYSIDCR